MVLDAAAKDAFHRYRLRHPSDLLKFIKHHNEAPLPSGNLLRKIKDVFKIRLREFPVRKIKLDARSAIVTYGEFRTHTRKKRTKAAQSLFRAILSSIHGRSIFLAEPLSRINLHHVEVQTCEPILAPARDDLLHKRRLTIPARGI